MITITADTVLSEVSTLVEAKAIAADMRKTVLVLETTYGANHPTAKMFSDRYFDFVDVMAEKFA